MIDMKSELEAEYLPFEIESFEHCGSIYLEDSRSKPLVDRFDY
ncbi:hypothetical protein [Pseudomonas syringae]|nr:hypothetical protein [Pseudomonas syringae]